MNEITQVVILAAGRSRRMESLSNKYPKCILEYKNETILERMIRQLKNNGIKKIVLVVGYKKEIIKKLYANDPYVCIVTNNLYEEDVNIYSLHLALQEIKGSCVILESDIVMENSMVEYIVGSDFEKKSVWFTCGKFKEYQYGCILKTDRVGKVVDIRIVPAYESKYKNYSKAIGLLRISENNSDIFKDLVRIYSRNMLKQYYFIPWVANLNLLPCIEGNAEVFKFFTFNKPEEYNQLLNVELDPDPIRQDASIELVDPLKLKHIEGFDNQRVDTLLKKIESEGIWSAPLLVENKDFIVLDGQHRLEVAKKLGLKKVPIILSSYEDVIVWSLKKEEKVSCEIIRKRIKNNSPYPYKTVKHLFSFQIPKTNYPLYSLRA
jgi:choline kinase